MGAINNMEESAAVVLGKGKGKLNLLAAPAVRRQVVTDSGPASQPAPVIPISQPSQAKIILPTSWSTTRGAFGLPFWAWGYVKDTAGNVVQYPKIRVTTPTGQSFGPEYTGDGVGAWNFAIPNDTYMLTITAPGYKSYTNPARTVSNGYKLFMEKLPVAAPVSAQITTQQAGPTSINAQPISTPSYVEQELPTPPPVVMMPQFNSPASSPVQTQQPSTVPSITNEFQPPDQLGGAATPLTDTPASSTIGQEQVSAPAQAANSVLDTLFPPAYNPYGMSGASGGATTTDESGNIVAVVPVTKEYHVSYFWLVTACSAVAALLIFNPSKSLAG